MAFDRCIAGDLRRQQHTASATFDQYSALGLPVPALENPLLNYSQRKVQKW